MFNNLCAFVFKTRNYNDVTRLYFVYVHRLVLFIGITNSTINILNTHFVTHRMILNARESPAIPMCVHWLSLQVSITANGLHKFKLVITKVDR